MSPTLIPLPPPPRSSTDSDARLSLLIVGAPGSGKRTVAKAIVALGTDADSSTGPQAGEPLVYARTRESLTVSPGSTTVIPAPCTDFILFLIDSTRLQDLKQLEATLEALPAAWWSYIAIGVTKVDLRSRSAFDPYTVQSQLARYSPTVMPIFHLCAPSPVFAGSFLAPLEVDLT